MSSSKTIKFSPFKEDDLAGTWKVTTGNWRIAEGAMCHVIPGGVLDREVEKVLSGSSDEAKAKEFARSQLTGGLVYALEAGGFDKVRFKFDISLEVSDALTIALDEWSVEWRINFGMKAVLTHYYSGSKGHEYDDQVLSPTEPKEVNSIEVVGDSAKIIFFLNGRQLFSADRSFDRPFRKIEIRSRCGVKVSNMVIEGEGPHEKRVPAKRTEKPLLCACVDFGDDLYYAPYTTELLDLMVQRLSEIGVQRIYWLSPSWIRPEAIGPDADPELSRHLRDHVMAREGRDDSQQQYLYGTIRDCYPFLPKVCKSAHSRGMEVFAVHKTIDLGQHASRGLPSPFANDHFINTHSDAMLHRLRDDNAAPADTPISTIKLYKDDDQPHNLKPEDLTVWTSHDNRYYSRVDNVKVAVGQESRSFTRHWQGGNEEPKVVQTITIEGLDIRTDYFAVAVANKAGFSFRNRLYRLSEVLDDQGRTIPVTRNLPGAPIAKSQVWDGDCGFVFEGFTGAGGPTGQWFNKDSAEMFQALDGTDVGIAFQRGIQDFVRSTPNPMHPDMPAYWTQWIQKSLDAGVDGVDLRIIHHRNIHDWANCGFGPLEQKAFKERYGRELKADASCREQHMEMMGDYYTDFLRDISKVVRGAGKLFQHHVSRPMNTAPAERAMTNIRWDWQKWIEEGIVDAVTLKNMETGTAFYDKVMGVAEAHNVKTYACPYLNIVLSMSDSWSVQLADLVRGIKDAGVDGLILYEVASFLRGTKSGDVVQKFPQIGKVLNA